MTKPNKKDEQTCSTNTNNNNNNNILEIPNDFYKNIFLIEDFINSIHPVKKKKECKEINKEYNKYLVDVYNNKIKNTLFEFINNNIITQLSLFDKYLDKFILKLESYKFIIQIIGINNEQFKHTKNKGIVKKINNYKTSIIKLSFNINYIFKLVNSNATSKIENKTIDDYYNNYIKYCNVVNGIITFINNLDIQENSNINNNQSLNSDNKRLFKEKLLLSKKLINEIREIYTCDIVVN